MITIPDAAADLLDSLADAMEMLAAMTPWTNPVDGVEWQILDARPGEVLISMGGTPGQWQTLFALRRGSLLPSFRREHPHLAAGCTEAYRRARILLPAG